MKYFLFVIPFLVLLFFSCKKEDPANNDTEPTDTTGNSTGPPKTFSAQIILTVLDSSSNPLDSVACIVPYHESTSAYIPYYTNANGILTRSVWYEEIYGGIPDSQFVSLEKGTMTDTIYIPLAGDNSSNPFTHIIE